MTTDLHRLTSGFSPLEFMVNSCQRCGFTGDQHDFSGNVEPHVAAEIDRRIRPHVGDEKLTTDTRWEFSALISEWRGMAPEAVAQQYLHAAWTAASADKEAYYRRRAADWFERALEEGVEEDERPTLEYLVGELYRRVGDTAVAHQWFDVAIEDATQTDLKELAEQQKTDPQEYISR
jgi:hypothetical protein